MGVEPTAACSAQPAANFEDWGAHRGTTTPTVKCSRFDPIWHETAVMSLTQADIVGDEFCSWL